MDTLPEELLEIVVRQLDQNSLAKLCRVSKQFQRIVGHRLYFNPRVDFENDPIDIEVSKGARLLEALRVQPDLASQIKTLTIEGTYSLYTMRRPTYTPVPMRWEPRRRQRQTAIGQFVREIILMVPDLEGLSMLRMVDSAKHVLEMAGTNSLQNLKCFRVSLSTGRQLLNHEDLYAIFALPHIETIEIDSRDLTPHVSRTSRWMRLRSTVKVLLLSGSRFLQIRGLLGLHMPLSLIFRACPSVHTFRISRNAKNGADDYGADFYAGVTNFFPPTSIADNLRLLLFGVFIKIVRNILDESLAN